MSITKYTKLDALKTKKNELLTVIETGIYDQGHGMVSGRGALSGS